MMFNKKIYKNLIIITTLAVASGGFFCANSAMASQLNMKHGNNTLITEQMTMTHYHEDVDLVCSDDDNENPVKINSGSRRTGLMECCLNNANSQPAVAANKLKNFAGSIIINWHNINNLNLNNSRLLNTNNNAPPDRLLILKSVIKRE